MKLPIIIITDGVDVEFFYSLTDAQSDMEPIDVQEGLFTAFDAEGQKLNPVPKSHKSLFTTYESIEIQETGEDRPCQLTEYLFGFYEDIGLNPEIIRNMDLDNLVEIGKLFFFKNFRKHNPRHS
ncbi:MAG: hypothetical protein KBD94_00360 [Pyrinomonadaceae bacterium]|nr:hypothetical protein [Pyrinomonadaceae bacterium]